MPEMSMQVSQSASESGGLRLISFLNSSFKLWFHVGSSASLRSIEEEGRGRNSFFAKLVVRVPPPSRCSYTTRHHQNGIRLLSDLPSSEDRTEKTIPHWRTTQNRKGLKQK